MRELDAHNRIAFGIVAMEGRTALTTSMSGSAESSSVGQYAISSSKHRDAGVAAVIGSSQCEPR